MRRRASRAAVEGIRRFPCSAFCPRCGGVYPLELKGEWFEISSRCSDCGVAVDGPPRFLVPSGDEARYVLLGWVVVDRTAITNCRVKDQVPYRFDEGFVLAVPSTAVAQVDRLVADRAHQQPDLLGGGGLHLRPAGTEAGHHRGRNVRRGCPPREGSPLVGRFVMFVPTGRAISPINRTNWEGTGVIPDVKVAAVSALETAESMAREAFESKWGKGPVRKSTRPSSENGAR